MRTAPSTKWLGIFILLTCASTSAVTLTVDRIDDDPSQTTCSSAPIDCSLRGAVTFAELNPGPDEILLPQDMITLDLSPGLSLSITTQITIRGVSRDSSVIAAATNVDGSSFSVSDGGVLTLEDVGIMGFNSAEGGAIDIDSDPQSRAVLRRTRLSDNRAVIGGAISLGPGGDDTQPRLEIYDSILDNNAADSSLVVFAVPQCIGGAIFLRAAALIDNSTINNNTAQPLYGGGICLISGSVTLTNSAVTDNSVSGSSFGGGIYADDSDVHLVNTEILDNSAPGDSGGGIFSVASTVVLENSRLMGNTSQGADIHISMDSQMTMTDTEIVGDSMQATDSNLTLTRTTITGPFAGLTLSNTVLTADELVMRDHIGTQGGALFAANSVLRLGNCTFVNNVAENSISDAGLGGAMFLDDSTLELSGCTFNQNRAGTAGGAINLTGSLSAQISNSTFSDNQANSGEALQVISGSDTSLTHTTIANNNGNSQIRIINGGVTLSNNAIDGFCNLTLGGNNVSLGGNVVTNSSCLVDSPNDRLASALGITGLSDFGGPTQVHLPTANGSLVNRSSANCSDTDQRGVSRSNPCDSGAVELTDNDTGIFTNGFESAPMMKDLRSRREIAGKD